MKINTITLIILLLSFWSYGQLDARRYHERRFPSVIPQLDVTYGSAPQWIFPYWNETLKMDIYQPTGDTLTKRPLLIFAHSGGFLNGAKNVDDMVAICDSFGQKGYVTASIAYRKGFNPLDGSSCERAVYRGIQDGKAAVRFFKQNASLYGIDTNFIYFGGMSAGGFIALHVGYMDLESERPASTYGGGTVNDLGCLDCSGNNYAHTSKVRGILDYWGAMQDTTLINAGDIPCLVMHGQNDEVVPHTQGHPFGVSTIPLTMGGGPIFQRLQNVGVYSEYYTSYGPHHMLDGSDNGTFPSSGPNDFWADTLLPRTKDFLLKTMKPHPVKLTNDTLYACAGSIAEFEIALEETFHQAQWHFSTSNISYSSTAQPGRLRISYANAGTYALSVLAFNEVFCASDTLYYTLIVEEALPFTIVSTDLGNNEIRLETNPSMSVNWEVNGLPLGQGPSMNYTTSIVDTLLVTAHYVSPQGACTREAMRVIHHDGLSTNNLTNADWSIVPNPFVNQLILTVPGATHVDIVDVTGRTIFHQAFNDHLTIETANWPSGIYVVTLQTNKGYINTRIVK